MPCVSVLFPCICHFLPWAVWCLACLYISCTVIASIELDAVNANRFYGEKLKQAVCEPRPRYMNVIVLGAQIQFNLTHSYPLLKKDSKNQMDLGMYKFSAIYSCVSLESWR